MSDRTLREIQTGAMWGAHTYSEEFNADPRAHRDAAHALLHITKASGKLAEAVDSRDHVGAFAERAVAKYLADVVICALRFANTWPGGPIDVATAIEERLASKGIGRTDGG